MLNSTSLPQQLVEFISARTLDDSFCLLKQNPQLLADEALQLLQQWISAEKDPEHLWVLQEHLQLLHRARQEGIEAVFIDQETSPLEQFLDQVSPELQATFTELTGLDSPEQLLESVPSIAQLGDHLEHFMGRLTSSYCIRAACYQDLDHFAAIEKSAAQRFRETAYPWIANAEPMPWVKVYDRSLHGQIWVAVPEEAPDHPVGFLILRDVDGTAYLEEMDVHPSHGRRGLGRRLVETACQWSKTAGYHKATLSTFRNVVWNAPFYLRMGFRTWEDMDLSAGFQQIRQQEKATGLPLHERVIMYRDLDLYVD